MTLSLTTKNRTCGFIVFVFDSNRETCAPVFGVVGWIFTNSQFITLYRADVALEPDHNYLISLFVHIFKIYGRTKNSHGADSPLSRLLHVQLIKLWQTAESKMNSFVHSDMHNTLIHSMQKCRIQDRVTVTLYSVFTHLNILINSISDLSWRSRTDFICRIHVNPEGCRVNGNRG